MNKIICLFSTVLMTISYNAFSKSLGDGAEVYDYLFHDNKIDKVNDKVGSGSWGDKEDSLIKVFGKSKPLSEIKDFESYPDEFSDDDYSIAVKLDDNSYDDLIKAASEKNDVPFLLIKSVIAAESNFDSTAISKKGAKGLMQLMDELSEKWNINPYDPEQNINVGTSYLAMQIHKYGNEELALAAYNSGPGNVDKYGGIPPFEETQKYVKKVMSAYKNNDNNSMASNY